MKKQTIGVIGLGQFGLSIVEELVRLGVDVISIDNDEEKVKKVSPILPTVYVGDSTDEDTLKEVGFKDCDIVIIAFGQQLDNTILTTALLKDLNVKKIIVRIDDPHYLKIIKRIGADEVITPPQVAGIDLANRILSEDFVDYYQIDKKYSMVSIEINNKFETKNLTELNANKVFGVNIVLIHRRGKSFVPGGKDDIQASDSIYVVGTKKEIQVFREFLNGKK